MQQEWNKKCSLCLEDQGEKEKGWCEQLEVEGFSRWGAI